MSRKSNLIKSSEITPESVYFNRRKFVQAAIASGTLMASGTACSRKIATAEQPEGDAQHTSGLLALGFTVIAMQTDDCASSPRM